MKNEIMECAKNKKYLGKSRMKKIRSILLDRYGDSTDYQMEYRKFNGYEWLTTQGDSLCFDGIRFRFSIEKELSRNIGDKYVVEINSKFLDLDLNEYNHSKIIKKTNNN